MKRDGLVPLVAALLLPAFAHAQDPDFLSRLDEPTTAFVLPVLQEAARDSLPMRALESKVLEGVAKRVPPQRIGVALEQLATELRSVRGSLRDHLPSAAVGDEELVAAARAVRGGVSADLVAELWSQRSDAEALAVPITVLGELVRRGIPARDAAGLMGHVVRTGVPPHVAAEIPGRFDGALRGASGRSPGQALAEALRTLRIPNPRGRGPGG